ncbi:unnamed protein product (macronuclear) [Paramecium tetraurelia]|uniref:VLIG-type G domain-containing protein n=1 Tax=Paramecium tetraurelia TaxID=5888 RepID=A0DSL4_PARTE|nr:uncharacterized protein GSPATT00019735001 [Paramecium tetraurelia]CAK86031.1 unnamed protein product [Paramecium tetraurelia]|eukprot:XP_001453428.1 hypothetical protein (macronuclear) [Paramecium tetraurelia strain d4-2]
MNQISQNLQIALLYSIKTDNSQDSQLDKIDFFNKTTKLFLDSLEVDERLQIKGLFGTHKEVEREIKLQINQEVTLQSYLNNSERGNLIALKFQNVMIFIFILSETFFVTKPINEKAVEIVLFRIIQDLTDNIKFCLNDDIFKNHWYQGDIIPFNQIKQRTEYHFAESENKEIQIYDCKWVLSQKNITNYQIINSQTLSPTLIRIRKLHFREEETNNFKKTIYYFIGRLLIQILNKKDKQTNQIMSIINIEHQSKSLKNMLDKISDELEYEVNDQINNLINIFSDSWRFILVRNKEKEIQKKYFEQQVNNFLQTVDLDQKWNFIYNHELVDKEHFNLFKEQMDVFFDKLKEKVFKILDKYKYQKNEIIEELKKQKYYEVERINLKLSRADENETGRVTSIIQIIENQQQPILSGNLLQLGSKFYVNDIFETKEKDLIIIITSYTNYNQILKTLIYFYKCNKPQAQLIKQFDFFNTEKAVYFYDYNRGHLFIFNFKSQQVLQLILTARGSIQNEQQVYYQQERGCSFLVSHVAYLKMVNKFIVLSKDKWVYKQQDQGQDFEKVKCRIQRENGNIELHDFAPSSQPSQKYIQIIACPSGKYFYLANLYCCDRYDVNLLKIDSISIDGPIKIFADFSDVIILGQLNQKTMNKKAKILCNLVSQKRFNKKEDNQKNVIGNPAFDVAKGSCIKFGPNSQFLLKEKNSAITLNVNNDYYNIVKSYLNIMKVNEIILSSTQLQSAEFKSEQIKNIIFSRVPLQLCTIENSNLIPLNDGFRQETQTETLTSVEQKVKQLHLGFLEEHLSNYNNKIFVVGIIGKQSSGKSYLLNRVFGTRFAVSSARCTEGVWGSIAYVEDQTFLVLDCEGLFNGARSDKEEIKMLAFLTAICDITILNSDLAFNRHFNDLFNHLVEASKQLNDEKLFKGILYFVLRDVSSQDNAGAEQELLKNLERLKEGGSEDIIFLKRLFNNKIAVESLVNYELKLFDDQIISVRKYILEKSAISSHWNCGRELIQIMKILLCQLELSDNTNVSLIDLQILIEKIFEECQQLWYDFSLEQVQDINLKLVQSDYKFPKFEAQKLIFFNRDLVQQLYENLITEDTISIHNKNMFYVKTQFNQMMEQRKEQIIQRAKELTNHINNDEVKEIIEKNMSMLKIFLKDQITYYQFCEDKCDECYLQCKHFKNHIEISQTLMSKLVEDINHLELQQKSSKIKNKSQEQEWRGMIDKIKEEIQNAEYSLEGLKIQNQIIEIKEKICKEKEAMQNNDFYDLDSNSINTSVFNIPELKNQKSLVATLEDIQNIQNLFENEIISLQNKKEQNIETTKQSKAQLEQLNQNLTQYLQDITQIEICQEELESCKKEISKQKLITEKELQNVQSEFQKIQIVGDEMNIQNLQVNVEDGNKILIEIQDEMQKQQLIYQQNAQELEVLLKKDDNEQIQYLEQLEQDINEFIQKQSYLEEEIEVLMKSKRDLEDIRQRLGKEQSKKFGKNKNIIEELGQQLKGFDELLINEKLSQCEIKQKELEINFINFENSQLFDKCRQEIDLEKENQIQNEQIEQQDTQIQTSQLSEQYSQTLNQQNKTQSELLEIFEKERRLRLINLFLQKKEEKLTQSQANLSSLNEEIQQAKNEIDNINEMIIQIKERNKLLDISQSHKSKICEFEIRLKDFDQRLQNEKENMININLNQESTNNKLDQIQKYIIDLEHQNDQIVQQIIRVNSRLNEIKQFQENLNEYSILNVTLREEEIKLKKRAEFESIQNLQQMDVESKIENLNNQISQLKQEKESLNNQLSTFNKILLLEQNLRELYDLKKQLVESKSDVHLCQRESHKCDQNCRICSDQKCDHKAGHYEKEEHLCNKQDHRCYDICQIKNCKRKCMKSFNHDEQHKCENDHPCMEKCQYCDKKCKKDLSDPHDRTNHDCLDNYCIHNCQLCQRRCCQPHKHSQQKDKHFCENVHYCQQQCQEDGICKIDYEVVQAKWKTKSSEFQYTKYIQKDIGKQICQKQIPAGCDKHDGKHLCKEKTEKQFHQCNQQCPECNTYCDLQYGHLGSHQSDRHRNKEDQQFTTQEGNQIHIQIQDPKDSSIRKYEIGENSAPETCDQSCKRKGRAHFHLVKCEGKKKCMINKTKDKARHSKNKYIGFEEISFDEVLCEEFWKSINWIHPILFELENINKCNYYCPLCIQQNGTHQFCDNNAWHTKQCKIGDHSFSCVETHFQNQIQGIDIAFVIDSTLSMEQYIKSCKSIIKDIIEKSKTKYNLNGQKLEINFAAVSYKDHQFPYKASQKIIDVQNFSSGTDIISFLNKITLENGFDYPEAVLDGLDATLKLNWHPKFEKLLYLIADSPPHGKQYHNYGDHFPEGCPCGLKQEKIFRILQNIKVKFKILKLNQNIEMMIGEFKKDFVNLQVLTPQDENLNNFQDVIVCDVCQFLEHNEITYQMKKQK